LAKVSTNGTLGGVKPICTSRPLLENSCPAASSSAFGAA
jgi:hypothetical protein